MNKEPAEKTFRCCALLINTEFRCIVPMICFDVFVNWIHRTYKFLTMQPGQRRLSTGHREGSRGAGPRDMPTMAGMVLWGDVALKTVETQEP